MASYFKTKDWTIKTVKSLAVSISFETPVKVNIYEGWIDGGMTDHEVQATKITLPIPLAIDEAVDLARIAMGEQINICPYDEPDLSETPRDSYGKGWGKAKKSCYANAAGKCQKCGEKTGTIDIQYKTPVKSFSSPDLAHTPDNLILLCSACHKIFKEN